MLKSLKENLSVRPDGIPSEVLKISSSISGPHLVRLFNESLGHGIFPNCLKTATVKPLFKADDHQNKQLQTHFSFTCNLKRFRASSA